ncbi:DUF1579 domain-containing protein [Myxococcus qinghaiensis]|uniref:DUF1579 domain-containing protein n=1 Tax=Myxococcus qinghaiensis TaxID=2906758 RepID=UPI0020A77F1C|nr:DUF1579 domain-containing protein [Myxococcus qinghaiensis]MCP3169081.1 DUF1579 domain-containing protein [Myxococcus qinghaiensis]
MRPSAVLFVAIASLAGCRSTPSTWQSNAVPTSAAEKTSTATVDPVVTAASALADAAKDLTGRWTCSGSVHGPGGASPSEVTVEFRPDLDKAWLRTDFAVSSGEYKYKFTSYRTFDAASRKWMNVIIDNLGGYSTSSSTDGITWVGESSGPMGKMSIKDTEHVVSPGEMNMRGEYAQEGLNWSTGYTLSCKR